MHRTSFALSLALLIATQAAARAQQVLTVNAMGGADFMVIQAAIDAAAPGDTVLVAAGFYGGGISITQSVRVVADDPNATSVNSPIEVIGLPLGSDAYIFGFRNAASLFNFATIRVQNCAGAVWIDECSLVGLSGGGPGFADYRLENSASVAISRCFGNQGISVSNSVVSVFDSEFIGVDGFGPASSGSPGLRVNFSFFHATNSTFTGGDGDPGVTPTDGGVGADIANGSVVDLRGSALIGGNPGFVLGGPAGSPGAPAAVSATATLLESAGPVHTLDVDAVTREGDSLDYTIDGPAGHLVALTFALAPDPQFFQIANGTLLTGVSFVSIGVGSIPASGRLTIPTTVPNLGPGVEVRTLFVQMLALDISVPAAFAGSGRGLTLLDTSF